MTTKGTERLEINFRDPVTLKDKTRLTSHGRTSLLGTLLSCNVLVHLPTVREVVVNVAGPVYQQHGRRCLHVLDRAHILDFVFGWPSQWRMHASAPHMDLMLVKLEIANSQPCSTDPEWWRAQVRQRASLQNTVQVKMQSVCSQRESSAPVRRSFRPRLILEYVPNPAANLNWTHDGIPRRGMMTCCRS